MKAITSLKEARALPVISLLSTRQEKQPDGTILNIPSLKDIAPVSMDEKAILFFEDKDGRRMAVEYDSEGAYKYESS